MFTFRWSAAITDVVGVYLLITVIYNHLGTNFRTLMSFDVKTLDTKLTTDDQNAHFSKLFPIAWIQYT